MRGAARAALALALLAALSAVGLPAAAADPIELIDVDAAPRTLAPGATASYEWTVRNTDTIPYNITVSVAAVPGWQAVLETTTVTGLAPNRAASIRLTVVAPERVTQETTAVFVVRFSAADNGAVVYIASRTANATVPSALTEKLVLGAFENPLPAPFDNEFGVFILDVLLWLAIAGALFFLAGPALSRLTKRTKTELDDIVLRIAKTPIAILLFLYGTVNSLTAIDAHLPPWLIGTALVLFAFGSTMVLFYVGYRIFRDVFLHLARRVAKRTASNIDDVFIPLIEKIGVVVLALAALGLLLGFLNVDLTLFVAGGVVTSMVIAFAAQDTLSNFFAGIFLLTERPFKEGDTVILADGDWVEIRHIGMRTTRMLRHTDGALITIPNNKLMNEKLANFSNPRDQGRVILKFQVAVGADTRKVREVLAGVIARCPHAVLQDPYKPIVRFETMRDSSLEFFVQVWIDHRDNRFAVQDFMNAEVHAAFKAAGIEIPFPQRTLHLLFEGGSPRDEGGSAAAGKVKERLAAREKPAQAPHEPRVGEADSGLKDRKVEPTETVGDHFDEVVGPAATVAQGSTLIDAVKSLLAVPVTRKVYVVDRDNKPVGTLTLEEIMKNVGHRLGAHETGLVAFLRYFREMQSDAVEGFTRKPTPVTRETKLVEVARHIVDERLNDFPVVDEHGRMLGELNSQRLLEVVLSLLDTPKDDPPATPGAKA